MSKRDADVLLIPEIVDVKIEQDAADPLFMINEEQFDSGTSCSVKRFKKKTIAMDPTPTPLKVKTCAILDLEICEQFNLYKLKCANCTLHLPLSDWKTFVKHLENSHQDLFDNVNEELPFNIVHETTIVNVPDESQMNVDNIKIKMETNISDYDDWQAEADDTDYVPEPEHNSTDPKDSKLTTAKKKKKKQLDDDTADEEYIEKHNFKRKDERLITLTRTDRKIVLGFLNMLKSHSLLWYRRQQSPKRYDRAMLEMAANFNAKYPQYVMSTNDIRKSIYRMKKLYEHANEPRKNQTEVDLAFKLKFPNYYELCSEIEEESKNLKIKCELCGFGFIEEIELQVHKFQMHRIGELPFKCKQCNRGFVSEKKVEQHEIKDHAEQPYVCVVCNKSFDKEKKLNMHLSFHDGAKQVCEICGKAFDSSYRYRRHMLHHAPPQFKCEICGKMLYEKYTLSEHMKTHYNQRNYACEICGKAFNINNGLQIHRRQVHKVKTQYVWGKKTAADENNTQIATPAPSTQSLNVNTPSTMEMTPSSTQNSLLEAPHNPPLTHAVFQDRLINDILSYQHQQQQENQV